MSARTGYCCGLPTCAEVSRAVLTNISLNEPNIRYTAGDTIAGFVQLRHSKLLRDLLKGTPSSEFRVVVEVACIVVLRLKKEQHNMIQYRQRSSPPGASCLKAKDISDEGCLIIPFEFVLDNEVACQPPSATLFEFDIGNIEISWSISSWIELSVLKEHIEAWRGMYSTKEFTFCPKLHESFPLCELSQAISKIYDCATKEYTLILEIPSGQIYLHPHKFSLGLRLIPTNPFKLLSIKVEICRQLTVTVCDSTVTETIGDYLVRSNCNMIVDAPMDYFVKDRICPPHLTPPFATPILDLNDFLRVTVQTEDYTESHKVEISVLPPLRSLCPCEL